MDFIFMLTQNDLTIEDCVSVFDDVADLGIRHIGFKDIGVGPAVLERLNRRIKAAGATSYLEVVSLSTADAARAARRAREIGVDCLLGGTKVTRQGCGEIAHESPRIADAAMRSAAPASISLLTAPSTQTRWTSCVKRAHR